MNDMVERVARALCIADGYTHPDEDWRSLLNGKPTVSIAEVHIPDGFAQRWRTYERKARIAIGEMRVLPSVIIEDPCWVLNHVKGATHNNPIPNLQAAIDAIVDEALK